MTDRKRRVEDVLESMGRMVVPVPDEPDLERERVIEAVNLKLQASREVRGARTSRRWLVLSAAAALLLSAGFSFAHFRAAERQSPPVARQDPDARLFRRGDAVRTGAQETRLGTLENGAQVQLGVATELTVSALVPGTDELVLDRGRVDLTVPKLPAGHTLSVTTPDATVTVRGTRFSVEVEIEGVRAITSVTVTQGSVWVRQGDSRLVLEAGAHWSSRPPLLASAPAALAPSSEPPGVSAPPAASSKGSSPLGPLGSSAQAAPSGSRAPTPELSTLAQENDMYQAASRAAREGNDALAVSDLNAMLARYPSSPLAQNACVDRFRALSRSGRTEEAVARARRYLADYPNGFARDEAKALVLQSLATP